MSQNCVISEQILTIAVAVKAVHVSSKMMEFAMSQTCVISEQILTIAVKAVVALVVQQTRAVTRTAYIPILILAPVGMHFAVRTNFFVTHPTANVLKHKLCVQTLLVSSPILRLVNVVKNCVSPLQGIIVC